MPREFSTSIAAEISGASVRMLDHWARTQLLAPSGHQAAGQGTRRRYTFHDLIVLRTVVDLRSRKCPLQQIRNALAELRKLKPGESGSEALSRLTLLTDGRRVYIVTDDRQAMDVITRQTVWAVPLGRHIMETTRMVQRLPQRWTEQLIVQGRTFRVQVSQPKDAKGFMAECRELPGTVAEGGTAEETVRLITQAIEAVLGFRKRQGRRLVTRQRTRNNAEGRRQTDRHA